MCYFGPVYKQWISKEWLLSVEKKARIFDITFVSLSLEKIQRLGKIFVTCHKVRRDARRRRNNTQKQHYQLSSTNKKKGEKERHKKLPKTLFATHKKHSIPFSDCFLKKWKPYRESPFGGFEKVIRMKDSWPNSSPFTVESYTHCGKLGNIIL